MSAELPQALLVLTALVLGLAAAGTALMVLVLSLLDVEPPVPPRPAPGCDRLPRPERRSVCPRAAHQRREHRRKVRP